MRLIFRSNLSKTLLALLLFCSFILIFHILLTFGSNNEVDRFKSRNIASNMLKLLQYGHTNSSAVSDESYWISRHSFNNAEAHNNVNCSQQKSHAKGLPTIFMITPTYRRAEQIPEITRTAQTLLNVRNLVWLVIEDAPKPSEEVVEYLANCGVKTVYMRAQMPDKFKKENNKPRGVANRNAGLEWVKKNANEGVVYFGDDDNTYDIRIFEEMRWTKRVSMFPVGLVTATHLSTPIVKDGKVIGYYDGWIANRKFPVDMAGFAVNVDLIKTYPKCSFPFKVGYEEDGFLKSLQVKNSDVEPLANNCTKVISSTGWGPIGFSPPDSYPKNSEAESYMIPACLNGV